MDRRLMVNFARSSSPVLGTEVKGFLITVFVSRCLICNYAPGKLKLANAFRIPVLTHDLFFRQKKCCNFVAKGID